LIVTLPPRFSAVSELALAIPVYPIGEYPVYPKDEGKDGDSKDEYAERRFVAAYHG
jgi:hypothetical protein